MSLLKDALLIFVNVLGICIYIHCCKVSLTVEGGVSLVGEHCPGTVRLFCEGINLNFMRWQYNGMNLEDISATFFPSHTNKLNRIIYLTYPFVSVQLLNFSQPIAYRADFFSVLAVDILGLHKQNVTSLSCGDSTNSTKLRVDISFTFPRNLTISSVSATYDEGNLINLKVQWMKLVPFCREYISTLVYEVKLVDSTSKSIYMNHTDCIASCMVVINDIQSSNTDNVILTLEARERTTLSNMITHYPLQISHNQEYFAARVNSSQIGCYSTFECTSIINYSYCSLQYTTDSNYSSLSAPMLTAFNTVEQFYLLVPNSALYFFEISVLVNESFLVKNRVQQMLQLNIVLVETRGVVIIVFSIAFLLSCIVHIGIVLLINRFGLSGSALKKRTLMITGAILFFLFLIDIILILIIGTIINEACSQNPKARYYNVFLDSMLVVSSLGIALVILVWISWGYKVFKNKRTVMCKSNSCGSHCDNNLYHDNNSKTSIHESLEEEYNTPKYTSSRPSNRNDTQDKIYEIEETFESLPADIGVYEPLRAVEKSKPVSNLNDANYSHLGITQPESAIPGILCSMRIHDMRAFTDDVDYNVLGRGETSLCTSVDIHDPCESVYGNLDEASIEPHGDSVYSQLRPGEKSRPVPNMTDSNYSHIDVKEQSPKRQLEKIRHFKKTKAGK